MPPEGTKLPPKTSDNIIDVSLRHVFTGFVFVFGGVFVVGSTLLIVRDLSRYKRQKAVMNGTLEIIKTIVNKKDSTDAQN